MKRLKLKDILFVSLQLLLFIVFFLLKFKEEWHLPVWIRASFLAVAMMGLLLAVLALLQLRENLSPFPTPVSQGKLIQSGLYKKVRHPVYSGLLLFFFGYALSEESLLKLFMAFLLLFYFKSGYEEKLLVERFPEYKEYKKHSYRFFPFL